MRATSTPISGPQTSGPGGDTWCSPDLLAEGTGERKPPRWKPTRPLSSRGRTKDGLGREINVRLADVTRPLADTPSLAQGPGHWLLTGGPTPQPGQPSHHGLFYLAPMPPACVTSPDMRYRTTPTPICRWLGDGLPTTHLVVGSVDPASPRRSPPTPL